MAIKIGLVGITQEHAIGVLGRPAHQHDPFDWMLVAQATHEGMTLVARGRGLRCLRRSANLVNRP
jgi:PIN domain nuclease of toxin-antitoxin system